MKICPVCKSRCFDDMNTCYGCMHKFKDTKTILTKWKEEKMSKIPEYFEIDSFPFIEDEQYFNERNINEDSKKNNDEKIVLNLEIPKSVLIQK